MKTISLRTLKKINACPEQVTLFKYTFGTAKIPVTLENCKRALAVRLNVEWAASTLLPVSAKRAYDKAIVSAWCTYKKTMASARHTYNETKIPAWCTYREAMASAWHAYQDAKAEAFFTAWKNQ